MPRFFPANLRNRFGHRMVALFVLCALLPLLVASTLLLREFSLLLSQKERRDIDNLTRGYGMSLLGRLNSADDVLQGLLAASGAQTGEAWAAGQVARYEWALRVRTFAPDSPDTAGLIGFGMDGAQREALAKQQPIVVWRRNAEDGRIEVHLVRGLPGGTLLDVELEPSWLWGDLSEVTADANLAVLDAQGTLLQVAGEQADLMSLAELQSVVRDRRVSLQETSERANDDWAIDSWEAFLRSRFQSPSWHIVAFRPRTTITSGLYGARVTFPTVVMLTVLLVGVVSFRLMRREIRPLVKLVKGTKKIAQLDFSQPVEPEGSDEFAHLARSFNSMSDNLRMQFSALETLAEVDRMLLRSPGLESILDSLMPRMAEVLGCRFVSVLLVDDDARDRARAYDLLASNQRRLPVRRVTLDVEGLRAACDADSALRIEAGDSRAEPFLAPLVESGARTLQLCALQHDGHVSGFLAIGEAQTLDTLQRAGVKPADFADRLSVVLANLERNRRLYQQAHFDVLTRLPNRELLRARLDAQLQRSAATGEKAAFLYIDLDHFKRVNDTVGHGAGDELLCSVARRLEAAVKSTDTVSRLGGDEFAVLLQDVADGNMARSVAQRILESLRAPFVLAGREYRVTASIGITLVPADGQTVQDLLRNGDIAMYRAKESGRAQAVFYEQEMQQRMQLRATVESGLHQALDRGEFRLVYQPIVHAPTGRVCGAEALLRWPNAPEGMRSPAVFIPVAEECGLIVKMGEWILRTACAQFEQWRHAGVTLDYVSVNVSARQLRQAGLVEGVLATLSRCGMKPHELQLEITESVFAEGESVANVLTTLARHGIRLALDDFGTGYSSLSYLRTFPIHTVKIDRSFVTEIPQSPAACRLVESIIVMSRTLDKHVVAEGIETEAQLRFLQGAGCESVQGYLLGKPMDAADIPATADKLRDRAEMTQGFRVPLRAV